MKNVRKQVLLITSMIGWTTQTAVAAGTGTLLPEGTIYGSQGILSGPSGSEFQKNIGVARISGNYPVQTYPLVIERYSENRLGENGDFVSATGVNGSVSAKGTTVVASGNQVGDATGEFRYSSTRTVYEYRDEFYVASNRESFVDLLINLRMGMERQAPETGSIFGFSNFYVGKHGQLGLPIPYNEGYLIGGTINTEFSRYGEWAIGAAREMLIKATLPGIFLPGAGLFKFASS